jgi:hypothetical protein
MSQLSEIFQWFGLPAVHSEQSFWLGVFCLSVVILTLIGTATVFRILRFLKGQTSSKIVTIKTPAGAVMELSLSALRDFIRTSLKEIDDIKLSKLVLHNRRYTQSLKLLVKAPKDRKLPELNDQIKSKVVDDLHNKLGLNSLSELKIIFTSFGSSKKSASKEIYSYNGAGSETLPAALSDIKVIDDGITADSSEGGDAVVEDGNPVK